MAKEKPWLWNKPRGHREQWTKDLLVGREAWSNQRMFSVPWPSSSWSCPEFYLMCFPFFLLSVLEFVLQLFCLCFTVLHCAAGGGGGRKSGFYFLGHQNTSDTSDPIGANCVSYRDQGLWTPCSKQVGLVLSPFVGTEEAVTTLQVEGRMAQIFGEQKAKLWRIPLAVCQNLLLPC